MSRLRDFVTKFSELGHKRVRKNPRIHGKAKTKRFNVKEPVTVDEVEDELCSQWWNSYRLQYNAVINLFKYELRQQSLDEIASSRTDDASEQIRRKEVSEKWNRQTRLIANEKLDKLLALLVEKDSESKLLHECREKQQLSELTSKVVALQAMSDQMITKDNLEKKLDEIMNANIVDYNFMVNRAGVITKTVEPHNDTAEDVLDDNVTPDPPSTVRV